MINLGRGERTLGETTLEAGCISIVLNSVPCHAVAPLYIPFVAASMSNTSPRRAIRQLATTSTDVSVTVTSALPPRYDGWIALRVFFPILLAPATSKLKLMSSGYLTRIGGKQTIWRQGTIGGSSGLI